MSFGRSLRRKAKLAVAPLLFLSLAGYFLWNASEGERGLRAARHRERDLKAAQAELGRADTDVTAWERRVAALRSNRLDRDALDERARAMLNLSDPADIIVPYAQGQRLF